MSALPYILILFGVIFFIVTPVLVNKINDLERRVDMERRLSMDQQDKTSLQDLFKEDSLKAKTILTIRTRPKLTVSEADDGMELNDGYEFDVNGALPEIADGIAKMAAELEPNGFGEKSGSYFVQLINEYYHKLTEDK